MCIYKYRSYEHIAAMSINDKTLQKNSETSRLISKKNLALSNNDSILQYYVYKSRPCNDHVLLYEQQMMPLFYF